MVTLAEPEPIEVLKYPYPYQAAFTVASDIDSSSLARFRAVHALFCGREVIKKNSPEWYALGLTSNCPRFDETMGGVCGLGLDFADSFFLVGDATTFGMHRYLPEESRFVEDSQEGANCATLVRQWLKEGQIDSYHTFLHYTRRQVEPLLKEFYQWCEHETIAKPRVWINHSTPAAPSGLCPGKLQPHPIRCAARLARSIARHPVATLLGPSRPPLSCAFARYHGDTPGSPYYVNDVLAANGLRYIWLNAGWPAGNQIALSETRQNGRLTILQAVTMEDGICYYQFERCFGLPSESADGTAYLRNSTDGFDSSVLVTEKNLEELCRCHGTCILYTHWTHFRSLPIADETIARFELLRQWRDAGKLWVTSTARLLEWTRRRTFLKVNCRREASRWVVEVEGVDDPIFGHERIDLKELNGLSFRVRTSEAPVAFTVNGRVLSQEQVHRVGSLFWLDGGGISNPANDAPG